MKIIYVNNTDPFEAVCDIGCMMSKVKKTNNSDFNDAIELMFFAYRDFIADPDVILRRMVLAARITVFCTLWPAIRVFALPICWIFCALPSKVWRVCCATLLTAIILNNALA